MGRPAGRGVEGEVLGVSPPALKPRIPVPLGRSLRAGPRAGDSKVRAGFRRPKCRRSKSFAPGRFWAAPSSPCWRRRAARANFYTLSPRSSPGEDGGGRRPAGPHHRSPLRDPTKTPRAEEEVAQPGNDLHLTVHRPGGPSRAPRTSLLDGYLPNAWRPLGFPQSRRSGVGREGQPRLPEDPPAPPPPPQGASPGRGEGKRGSTKTPQNMPIWREPRTAH